MQWQRSCCWSSCFLALLASNTCASSSWVVSCRMSWELQLGLSLLKPSAPAPHPLHVLSKATDGSSSLADLSGCPAVSGPAPDMPWLPCCPLSMQNTSHGGHVLTLLAIWCLYVVLRHMARSRHLSQSQLFCSLVDPRSACHIRHFCYYGCLLHAQLTSRFPSAALVDHGSPCHGNEGEKVPDHLHIFQSGQPTACHVATRCQW